MQLHDQHALSLLPESTPLGIQSHGGFLLVRRHTHGSSWHGSTRPSQTHRCKSWAYHASSGWYIGPSLKHYCCIRAIMEGTGGRRLTDTFHFKHCAMPIPTITPTNRIITATRDLTAAILSIQEAPPNKLQAIATLHHILLGKVPPTPIPMDPPIAPVPPPLATAVDEEPIHIWNPNTRLLQHIQDAIVPGTITMPGQHAAGPAFIDDHDDSPVAPPACAAQTARTRAQHRTQQQVHLINLVITEALMPMIDMKPAALFSAHGYVAATRALLENTYGVVRPANSPVTSDSNNYIGAIINDITRDVC